MLCPAHEISDTLPLAGVRNVRPSRRIDSRCSRLLPVLAEKHVQPGEYDGAGTYDDARGNRSPQRVSPSELPDGEHRREDGDDDRRRNHPERDRDDALVIEITSPVSGDLFRHTTILRPRWVRTAERRHLVCNHVRRRNQVTEGTGEKGQGKRTRDTGWSP